MKVVLFDVWVKGGEGGIEFGNIVLDVIENNNLSFVLIYDEKVIIEEKVLIIVREIYGVRGVNYILVVKK